MKKLAGTKWGANSKILKQLYIGAIRPVMEYRSSAWATAAKPNTNRLTKVQNAGMRIISGGMKITPVTAMEECTGLLPLDLRQEEKFLTHSEKLKRLPSHPAYQHLQAHTKNRLKRSSFNHLTKELWYTHRDILPSAQEEQKNLQNAEAWDPGPQNLTCISEVPGVTKKGDQLDAALKALTQEMLQDQYNTTLYPCLHRRILRCSGQEWGQ